MKTYSRFARVVHWLTVALIAVQNPVRFYMAYCGNTLEVWDAVTGGIYNGHKILGVTILPVVLWRLVYRIVRGAPEHEPSLERWQRTASRLNHWGLYLLLIAVPIAGYVGISLFPALEIFGMFSLPAVVPPDREAADTAFTRQGSLVRTQPRPPIKSIA